jgi:hypothetical protein
MPVFAVALGIPAGLAGVGLSLLPRRHRTVIVTVLAAVELAAVLGVDVLVFLWFGAVVA